jgi:septal ring factor EnvC (AmiA/AmiB activator)
MKIVIVASSPDCNTTDLQTLLQASGLQSARPSAKHGLSGSDWHTKLYKALDQDEAGLNTQSPLSVGIAWLELAVDLLVTNLDQPEWGFADSRATWVLDFWRNVDPQSRFVLAYTPPQHVDLSNPQALSTWLSYNGELLRFYKANKERAILVDSSEVGIYPARLSYTCQKTWSLTTVDWHNLGTVAASAPPNTYYPVPPVAAKLGKLLQQSRTPLLNPSTAVMASKKSGKPQGMLGALFALFGKSKQLGEDLDRSQAELSQAKAELDQANLLLSELGKDKDNLQTQAQDLQAQIDRLNAQAEALQAQASANAQAHQTQVQTLQAERQALQAQNQTQSQEGELLLSQLHQVQEQLVNTTAAEAALKAQLDNVSQALEAKSNDLASKAKELADVRAAAQTAADAAQAAAAQAHHEAEVALNVVKAERDKQAQLFDAKAHELANKHNELEAKAKELADVQVAAQKAAAAAQAAAAQAEHEAEVVLNAVKAERDKQVQLLQQAQVKHQDSTQENELLLLQLMQAQEELVEYYEQKGEFEKLYLAYKARWERLEKRLPNYLDFGAIDIVNVDGLSDIPTITWQVKDFAQAGVALSEFSFVTTLQDGHPGLGLLKDGQPQAFVPKLLNTHKDHLATFLGLGTTEFRQLTAAITILEHLDAGNWQGFEFPAQFDLNFWRPSIQLLIAQLKTLPALLRYDEVHLKRELINPDYEHLWLEFRGLSMGATHLKKFEIRLGAALVQPHGFSHYPKFEIPLIDGKTKPFDSWYAESHDHSGAKLELRFALDKNVFDVAVWSKLSEADRALLSRLIYAMPDALKRLEAQKVAIHRPWATWVNFAAGAVQVLESSKPSAKAAAAIAAPAKLAPSAAPAVATVEPKAPPVATPKAVAKADKVIHIPAAPASSPVLEPATAPIKYAAAQGLTARQAKQARKQKA